MSLTIDRPSDILETEGVLGLENGHRAPSKVWVLVWKLPNGVLQASFVPVLEEGREMVFLCLYRSREEALNASGRAVNVDARTGTPNAKLKAEAQEKTFEEGLEMARMGARENPDVWGAMLLDENDDEIDRFYTR